MKRVDEKSIKLDRELNELDLFVLDFVKILESHAKYVLISGYVALLFGRSRTTEDVDLFIEKMDLQTSKALYEDLLSHGFWALNASSGEDMYDALAQEKIAIRFAKEGRSIPNVELKFVKDALDMSALHDRIKVITKNGELWISGIEMQIAYKRFVLQSDKDFEDARHLQRLFEISDENINKYKRVLREHGRC